MLPDPVVYVTASVIIGSAAVPAPVLIVPAAGKTTPGLLVRNSSLSVMVEVSCNVTFSTFEILANSAFVK